MDEEDELEELEKKLEELKEKVEAIEAQIPGDSDAQDEKPYQQIVSSDRPFVLHWISGVFGGVDSLSKARWAFTTAVEAKKDSSNPVEHGDVMILDASPCPWYGLYVERGSDYQTVIGYDPDDDAALDVVVWNGCSGSGSELPDCSCDEGSGSGLPELISGGIDESDPDTSWKVSLGACTWFNNLMSVSLGANTGAGQILSTKTRAFTINKCGEIINIGAEVEDYLLIPCECAEDDCPASADECLTTNGITDVSSYTLTDSSTGLQGHVAGGPYTLTRTHPNCSFWEDLTAASGWSITRSFSGLASPCPTAGVVTYSDPADPLYVKTFYNSGTSSSIPGTYNSNAGHGSVVIS
jgi:hypothetical protein